MSDSEEHRVSVRVSGDLYDELVAAAEEERRKFSDLVRLILEDAVAQRKKDRKATRRG